MMALRQFGLVPYMPVLSLRPAEMRALEELPDSTKNRILPIVHLRAWMSAQILASGLQRLREAYGDRPVVVAVSDPEVVDKLRPVHQELDRLRVSDDGYRNWCNFINETENFIPALQLRDPAHLIAQLQRFYALGRGVVVIVEREALSGLSAIAQAVRAHTQAGADVCFVIDLGRGYTDPLERAAFVRGFCDLIWDACPLSAVSISASSFPADFRNKTDQEIYERTLFNAVLPHTGGGGLIYSDRGSARFERQRGGGGMPAPRIDYPLVGQWKFFRSDLTGFQGYREQALLLVSNAAIFDPLLRIWGTQMIERTAAGDSSAIKTPARSTAARINLHLHRQAWFGDPIGLYDTEDDWED
ncbi:hypothetical protein TPR58_17885 [Sphingomonas sp. HF-S3]|uniref:Beta protein n=1 Tax=Sphingomonas rustica TaxID=3103142 RepID=A0ABV0BBX2_9SPHN